MADTDRLALPLLTAAQAQKEVTHNEALAVLDVAVQAVVVSIAPSAVPVAPITGQCWIVGAAATGAWAGRDGAIAAWTSGGWRFIAPFEGMSVWSLADATTARRSATAWITGTVSARRFDVGGQQVVGPRQPAVADPTGGSVIDVQARVAIGSVLGTLRQHGLISPN